MNKKFVYQVDDNKKVALKWMSSQKYCFNFFICFMTICYGRMHACSHGVQFYSIGSVYAFHSREGWMLIVKAFSKCDNVVYVSEEWRHVRDFCRAQHRRTCLHRMEVAEGNRGFDQIFVHHVCFMSIPLFKCCWVRVDSLKVCGRGRIRYNDITLRIFGIYFICTGFTSSDESNILKLFSVESIRSR
jgi:hypothetical protein